MKKKNKKRKKKKRRKKKKKKKKKKTKKRRRRSRRKKKVSLYSIRSPSFGHLFPRERTLHLKVNLYMTEFTVQKGFPEGERQQFQHEDVQRDCQ